MPLSADKEEKKPSVKGNKMILIVEDDQVLLRVMYLFLKRRSGFAIATASDGDTALKMAQRLKPNVILLDLILPKMDGFSVLKSLKSDPMMKDIPVIVLSNLGDTGDIDKAKDLGAADYFVKANTDLAVILEKIKNY
ncbi:MAG: response regulator [Candidatus Buchananbacteria bacterium]|nr:response regulator [Candidatus Buchananbacteria bacterium]